MKKIKVGVAGYGVIGQCLADGVALQGDMELGAQYDRLLLYFRLARLTPYFCAYSRRDCLKRISCVTLCMWERALPFG